MLLSLVSYGALGKSVNLPKPQSPHLYDGRNGASSVHLIQTSEDQGSNLDCERAVTKETYPTISGLTGAVREDSQLGLSSRPLSTVETLVPVP